VRLSASSRPLGLVSLCCLGDHIQVAMVPGGHVERTIERLQVRAAEVQGSEFDREPIAGSGLRSPEARYGVGPIENPPRFTRAIVGEEGPELPLEGLRREETPAASSLGRESELRGSSPPGFARTLGA
jgi:hypothetical protein